MDNLGKKLPTNYGNSDTRSKWPPISIRRKIVGLCWKDEANSLNFRYARDNREGALFKQCKDNNMTKCAVGCAFENFC